jgi:hypothetical protein
VGIKDYNTADLQTLGICGYMVPKRLPLKKNCNRSGCKYYCTADV